MTTTRSNTSYRRCLPRDAHPECVTFHRAIEALCAWTTGPNHLLNGRFMRTSIPLTVYIADLPRSPIPSVTANQLLEHWRSRRDWAEITALPSLVASICVEDPQRLSGASHCEAGLMASLLLCHNLSDEPPALSGGYSQVEREAVPIGAAKKCCPICRMLAELLLERGVNVELPGRHDHYHPWVAPHWLPVSILEALEDRLLDTVDAMLAFAKPHATRTSSPGSEDGDWVTADHEYAKTILDELNELRGRNL
ncbi:hypothetical protein DFH06DRAFT_718849 [Mycena polygramma]|nr:hypothetical protein DFH06DRAFT_718849 [Mycena polygramma]